MKAPTDASTSAPACTGSPWTWISPESGRISPTSILMAVVFPAPFGPSRPTTWPVSARKLIPSTARMPSLYVLTTSVTTSGTSARSGSGWTARC